MKSKSEVLKDFKQLLSTKYSQQTVDSYIYYVGQFLKLSKNVPLRVTNNDFLDYNIYLVNSGVSDSTRNVAINAVKCYFKIHLKIKIKDYSSLRPRKSKFIPKTIKHNILVDKLNSITNIKHRLILKLGYCGLRSGEVINLKTNDIDVERGYLKVFGKGNKERIVPISDDLIYEMICYCEEYDPGDYFFKGQSKPKYSASSIRSLVKTHIGDYSFHSLRHSFATNLLRNGVDVKLIKDLLGHENLKTTEMYLHVKNIEQRSAMLV